MPVPEREQEIGTVMLILSTTEVSSANEWGEVIIILNNAKEDSMAKNEHDLIVLMFIIIYH